MKRFRLFYCIPILCSVTLLGVVVLIDMNSLSRQFLTPANIGFGKLFMIKDTFQVHLLMIKINIIILFLFAKALWYTLLTSVCIQCIVKRMKKNTQILQLTANYLSLR